VRELGLPALGCCYNGSGEISTTTFATCTNEKYMRTTLLCVHHARRRMASVLYSGDAMPGCALCHVNVITAVVGVVVEVTL
jgi:hypothetical protein